MSRLRHGSGGVGLCPGGEGIERDLLMLEDVTVSLITERRVSSAVGPGRRGAWGTGRELAPPGRRRGPALPPLTSCVIKALYLRNVPDEVGKKLQRLAAREGLSVSAFATRELATIARRADHPALLADLPDLGVAAEDVAAEVEAGRVAR